MFFQKVLKVISSRAGLSVCLGVVVALIFGIILDHIVVYQSTGGLFLKDIDFAMQTISMIGGSTVYVSWLIGALCQWTVAGAILIGAMSALIFFLLDRGVENNISQKFCLALIPVLYLLSGYELSLFIHSLRGVLAVMIIFAIWRSIRGAKLRAWVALVAILLSFFAASEAYIICVTLIVIHLAFDSRLPWLLRATTACIAICGAWLAPLLGAWTYNIPLTVSRTSIYGDQSSLDIIFYILIGVVAILSHVKAPKTLIAKWWVEPSMWLVLMVGAITISSWAFNPTLRLTMLTEQAADNQDWDEVLRLSAQSPADDYVSAHLRTIALFRRGELVEKLFDRPQIFGPSVLFIPWTADKDAQKIKLAHLAWANVGLTSEALRLSFESMAGSGPSPLNVSLVSHYNRLLQRDLIASRFDKLLSRALFFDSVKYHSFYTPHTIAAIDCDSTYISISNPYANLALLTARDSTSRAATDYMALFYLLSKDLPNFSKLLPRLDQLYGGNLPLLYQQVLALYMVVYPDDSSISDKRSRIDRSVFELLHKFNQAASGGNLDNLPFELRRTYWYYMMTSK
ncbi:MAG: DUF6057 family protein [Mucinivorans sp.]